MNIEMKNFKEYELKSLNLNNRIILLLKHLGYNKFEPLAKEEVINHINNFLFNNSDNTEFDMKLNDFLLGVTFKVYTSEEESLNVIKNDLITNKYESNPDYLKYIVNGVMDEVFTNEFDLKQTLIGNNNNYDYMEEELECYDILVNMNKIVSENIKEKSFN